MTAPAPPGLIGVIGDVHAEDERLALALAYLRDLGCERLLCTGDVVDGLGDAVRCCELLDHARVDTVRGNHDRWLLGNRMRDLPEATRRDSLAPSAVAFLSALPAERALASDSASITLCHGLGADDMASVREDDFGYAIAANDALQALVATGSRRVVINGHTHRAMVRHIERLTIINAGTIYRRHDPGVLTLDLRNGAVSWHTWRAGGSGYELARTLGEVGWDR